MPVNITYEELDACLGEAFALTGGQTPLELRLIEIKRLADTPDGPAGRLPFSLLFRGPLEPVMPQRIYPLHNARIGEVELFLVPVGPDAEGMCYEAVIN